MLRTIIKTLWSRKRRLAGTSIAVVLGVAFLAATLILGATTKAGFRDTFTAANDGHRRRRPQRDPHRQRGDAACAA